MIFDNVPLVPRTRCGSAPTGISRDAASGYPDFGVLVLRRGNGSAVCVCIALVVGCCGKSAAVGAFFQECMVKDNGDTDYDRGMMYNASMKTIGKSSIGSRHMHTKRCC